MLSHLVKNEGLYEIASLMDIDYTTVRYHIKNLKEKTGARDIAGLCILAARSRFVLPEY